MGRFGSHRPRIVRANGTDIAYLEAGFPLGAGDTLVMVLHGFPDTAWSFAPLLTTLADACFRAVAPFLRGYPPSAIPADRDYSGRTLGRDAIALAEHLGAADLRVVGHDWGAVAAYAATALRPDYVKRIVAGAVPHPRRFLLRPTRAQLGASHYMFKFQILGWAERHIPHGDFAWLRPRALYRVTLGAARSAGGEVVADGWQRIAVRQTVSTRPRGRCSLQPVGSVGRTGPLAARTLTTASSPVAQAPFGGNP